MTAVRIWLLLNVVKMNGQNLTSFCIHIIIDNLARFMLSRTIYVLFVNGLCCFFVCFFNPLLHNTHDKIIELLRTLPNTVTVLRIRHYTWGKL